MLALDCETCGLDLYHSAKPFFVSICDDESNQTFYEWTVDPITRVPEIPKGDIEDIRAVLGRVHSWTKTHSNHPDSLEIHSLIGQNHKFDATALNSIGISNWPWRMTHDTLIAGHILASNHRHDLTAMVLEYLGHDIEPKEKALETAVKQARNICRHRFTDWAIAKKDNWRELNMPSLLNGRVRDWQADMWLPRRIALELPNIYPSDHPWHTVLSEYANADTAVLIPLWNVMKEELLKRDLWEIYLERRKAPLLAYELERRGVTANRERLKEMKIDFGEESVRLSKVCVGIAESYDYNLQLPDGAMNNNLKTFLFDHLQLPTVKETVNGNPSFDKYAIDEYRKVLPRHSMQLGFITSLSEKRARDSAVSYLEGYERFWQPAFNYLTEPPSCYICDFPCGKTCNGCGAEQPPNQWYVLHPSLNPTGTDTLRWACSFFNEQNISKREGFNLRYAFGPAPGREWWALDAKNIERRIPAYEAGETDIIALLERPDDPPYFGSEHLLVAHILYPKEFEACRDDKGNIDGRIFKKRYAANLYQWVKNFNFALQYNCGEAKGDQTAHLTGAFRMVKARFNKQEELNQYHIRFANKHGYVETMSDKTVNPHRGYPLLCSRTERGDILTTIPLSYHVQGTAMWWTYKAMLRTSAHLDELRRESKGSYDGYLTMQVHDELDFDLPKRADPCTDPENSNLPLVRKLQGLMEQGGDDLGLPTPVGIEYHPDNWRDSITF